MIYLKRYEKFSIRGKDKEEDIILGFIPKKKEDSEDGIKILIPNKYIDYDTGIVDIKALISDLNNCINSDSKEFNIEIEYEYK